VKIRQAQSSFALGELSPLLAGRSDIAQYRNGAERLLNRRLLAQGGTDTRPGTRFFANAPQANCRIIPYVFSQTQRYLCVLINGGANFFLPDGTACAGFSSAPWTTAQLPDIRFCQSADTLLLFHPSWHPVRIQRSNATTFVATTMPIEYRPFDRFVAPDVTCLPSAGSGAVTLTFSAAVWTSAVVGEEIEYKGRRLSVTGFTSATVLDAVWADVSTGLTIDASIDWKEWAWSTRKGWPICGTFYDGRLAVGGTENLPNTVWLSKAGAFFNWQIGTNDADAISEVAAGEKSGRIQHLFGASRLLAMTDSTAFAFIGSSSGAITPKTIALRKGSENGIGRLRPVEVDGAAVFLDQTNALMREIRIDESVNSFEAPGVSLLAEHLIRQPTAITVMPGSPTRPETYAMFTTADGTLVTYHSLRAERITAFVEWNTAGFFRDVCAVGPDMFVLTERSGTWRIEKFEDDAAPLDCAKRVTSATQARGFAGFTHLAGQTVGIVSRGHDLGDVAVDGAGIILLPDTLPAVFEIEAGFRYTQTIRPMPADVDLATGAARGLMKRLLRVSLVVDRSGQLQIAGRDVLLTFQGDDFTVPPTPKTGVLRKKMNGKSLECQFDVNIVGAQKVTVLSMTRELSMDDPAND
jgi:hypothetical protein